MKNRENHICSEQAAFSRSWEHQFLEEQEKNNKLEKENKKLKEEIVKGNEAHKCNTKTIWSGIEKINKLEDENKKLKEQLNTVIN
tara:strand:+ start:225 stop:479 length:255 start_codon:yes stop_codon:yes gene_type:complete